TCNEVGVVKDSAVGVQERVSELSSLVDRTRRLGRGVAGYAARERELSEQATQALLVAADMRIQLGVGALEVRVRDHARAAVTGPRHEDDVQLALADHSVAVRVHEVQARGRTPVPKQSRLDVLDPQRLPQQRVVQEIDLTHRQVVRRAPVSVEILTLLVPESVAPIVQVHCGDTAPETADREPSLST